jgi:hypothetical protein
MQVVGLKVLLEDRRLEMDLLAEIVFLISMYRDKTSLSKLNRDEVIAVPFLWNNVELYHHEILI